MELPGLHEATFGLDPDDPDRDRMEGDWARPADPAARARLHERLLRRRVPGLQ